ncbi:MAG TPA: formyltransferase family protein [Pseudolysinimonas sp.]|nr:formyltransferase family protein [Pseudolysinimonas sp.]
MLVAFAYAFSHQKTYDGILALVASGLTPDVVVAQDFKQLKVKRSPTRVGAQGLTFPTAEELCERFGIEYLNLDHDSPELAATLTELQPEAGIILGARILKQPVIEPFHQGIVNLHPGVLPLNRGLDNLKWAILRGLPQGVTSHFIDTAIDRGRFIDQRVIDVYPDDSLLDINLRIQNTEMNLMTASLHAAAGREISSFETLGEGEYNTAMDPEVDERMLEAFEDYKARYAAIKDAYTPPTV